MFTAGEVETVTVVRPPGRDRFGDPRPGTNIEHDIPGCLIAPGPSGENLDAANQVDTHLSVYAPPGADVTATDQVRVSGDLYQVVGAPRRWATAGVEIALHRVTG
jgi:hypothetical protein